MVSPRSACADMKLYYRKLFVTINGSFSFACCLNARVYSVFEI
jgi:hypothetical protein